MRIFTLIDLTTGTATPAPSAGRGFVLLTLLTALLGVFILGLALLTVLRRRRAVREQNRTAAEKAALSGSPDPWYEAGRRMNPPEND